MKKSSPAEIRVAQTTIPLWRRRGNVLKRTFEFTDFPQAIRFVNALAKAAEKAQHHPDIDIRWNKVALTLTTHDAGGLTSKDFDLASQADRLALKLVS